jgi:ribosomal protein S18 acetylase RimI-like enzyme
MVELVQLQAPEWRRLRSIRLRALRDAPDAFGSTFEEANAWSADSWSDQLRTLPTVVAVKDGADVGMARYGPDDTRARTGWLISLWVAPAARRMGVGSALTDAIVELARAAGVTRLLLDVADSNAAATALYEAKGFAPNGEIGSLPPPRTHVREHQRERRI